MTTYPVSIIAKLLDLSPRRIQMLVREGVIPAPVKREYDLIGCTQGYVRYLRKLCEGQGSLTLTDVRIRKELARAEREEIMVKKLKGELILKGEPIGWLIALGSAAKMGFWNLPKRLAPVLAPLSDEKEIEMIIRNEVREVITTLQNAGKEREREVKGQAREK